MVYISCMAMDVSLVLTTFRMNAEVLYIGNRDIILWFSSLANYGFLVDTQNRCLRNVYTCQVILC